MNASVNEACISCGLCASTCPQVFSLGDGGIAQGSAFESDLLDAVQEARDNCPVSAISING